MFCVLFSIFIELSYDKTILFTLQGVGPKDQKVAIKTFQFTPESYIAKETATMGALNHDNVVKYLGLEQIIGTNKRAMIMELCEKSLRDVIDENPKGLTSSEFMRLCQHLVSAMQHLRSKNVVHRDLKPENILLSHCARQVIYKLADFGCARFLKTNESYGSLYGTYEYMHPDIFAKFYGKALNLSSPKPTFNDYHELWSLGVTIYEAATGRLPFNPKERRNNPAAMFRMIAEKENDCISATEIDGTIKWSRCLPESCALGISLKQTITTFLAGLLQVYREYIFYLISIFCSYGFVWIIFGSSFHYFYISAVK